MNTDDVVNGRHDDALHIICPFLSMKSIRGFWNSQPRHSKPNARMSAEFAFLAIR